MNTAGASTSTTSAGSSTDARRGLLFDRFGADDVGRRLRAAGVFEKLARLGFEEVSVTIDASLAFPCVAVSGVRDGRRSRLVEARLGETTAAPALLGEPGHASASPLDLLLVYWLREEDPTRAFSRDRPALPLQNHPGLGILRRAFQALVSLANDIAKDGVASVPKLYHDAAIFFRSRLFLFLDPAEQGRFQALERDLAGAPLGDASLALIGGCVSDDTGRPVAWRPGLLVFPLSDLAAGYFNSEAYAAAAAVAFERARFTVDRIHLASVRAKIAAAECIQAAGSFPLG